MVASAFEVLGGQVGCSKSCLCSCRAAKWEVGREPNNRRDVYLFWGCFPKAGAYRAYNYLLGVGMDKKDAVLNSKSFAGSDADISQVSLIDISNVVFNPHASDLTTTWSSHVQEILVINPFQNGITVSLHRNSNGERSSTSSQSVSSRSEKTEKEESEGFSKEVNRELNIRPDQFHLRLRETRDFQLPAGKYYVFKENYATHLEDLLSQLDRQGKLDSMVCYFGSTADPFFSFHKKFAVTMKCLDLLDQYRPGFVVAQSRSPMIIAGLPLFKSLGERLAVVIPVESHLERVIFRYTPGQAKVSERLLAADGLRAQGITVNLAVSPLLPYGDYYKDAWAFAELLVQHGDYISLGCLSDGSKSSEKDLRDLELAKKLAEDKQTRWLRPYSYRVLYQALKTIAPDKLKIPPVKSPEPSQLDMFAA